MGTSVTCIKLKIVENRELPWDGYSEDSPLFSKDAIALITEEDWVVSKVEAIK